MRIATISLFTLTIAFAGATDAHEFSWENLLIAKIKLEKGFDYDAHVDSYMQTFRPNVWKRYKNDEFELDDKRRETITLMKDRVERFRIKEAFVLYTTMTIGEYDFARSLFPVVEATEHHYWYKSEYAPDFPSSLRVTFKNPGVFGTIPMEKSTARDFLRRRKNRYGNVSRRVGVAIKFTVVELKEQNELLGDVETVQFFEDTKRTRPLYLVKKVTEKKESDVGE